MNKSDASNLCIKCGACCDGTAFDQVILVTSDLNSSIRKMDIIKEEDEMRLKQPCTAHINNTCSIYSERPAICRAYKCKLLKEYEGDRVDENQALETIAKLKEARKEVDLLLQKTAAGNKNWGLHARVMALEKEALLKMTLAEYRKKHGVLLIKYRLLQELLTLRFGVSFEKKRST